MRELSQLVATTQGLRGQWKDGLLELEGWALWRGCLTRTVIFDERYRHHLVNGRSWGERLWSPSFPSFPPQELDDKGTILMQSMVNSWGNRAEWREVESRWGGKQKIPSTVIFIVGADLGKQNGKETICFNLLSGVLFRNAHTSWCKLCPWIVY